MKIEKPIVFISHAHKDKQIVKALHGQLERVFAKGLSIFASSIEGNIRPGDNWFENIKTKLETATIFIVLVTPVSKDKNWVWFELGAFWSKTNNHDYSKGHLFPLLIDVTPADLERPLSDLQAMSIDKTENVRSFFETLCAELDFGNIELLEVEKVIASIPHYDMNETPVHPIYNSPYDEYADVDLKNILSDYLDEQKRDYEIGLYQGTISRNDRVTIFGGETIHFDFLDTQLKLPIGTASRLLEEVAEEFNLTPMNKGEKTIKFRQFDEDDFASLPDDIGDIPF